MERAVYFDGWLKDEWCTHPSMPQRGEMALRDLEAFHATSLVWAGLGGGSISLPWLYHEAFGPVDPRARLYGAMNDAQFIARCNEKGIKLFAIVFEVQGWQFPAIFDEDGGLVALNQLGGREANGHYGLRAFTSGEHDDLFEKRFADWYPNGVRNTRGQEVTDLLEECCARDYHDVPIHAAWVEMPESGQYCYQMCRNNPVWREYLKKIIEIQIDAGAAGVQLDESELPITALRHGGCFCHDCDTGFTAYLQNLRAGGKLSAEYDGINLEGFSYKQYILDNNIDFPNGDWVPLFREYWEYQLANVKRYFTELCDYIREYSLKTRGEAALVSGNFFNGMPVYYPIRDAVDIVTTEMEQTLFRQPHWYRYINGFAAGKDVMVAENPYGSVVPELVDMLNHGKGYDLYRLFLLEATAYGSNMAIPYGGWMGSTMRDAFCPPKDISAQIGTFLAEKDHLIQKTSGAPVGVLYSWPSNYWLESTKNSTGDLTDDEDSILFFTPTNFDDPNTTRLPFWEAIRDLSDKQVVYDVVAMGDGDYVEDEFAGADLTGYSLLVLPECTILTDAQKQRLLAFAAEPGKRLLVFGRNAVGDEEFAAALQALAAEGKVVFSENPAVRSEAMALFHTAYEKAAEGIPTARVNKPGLGLCTHKLANGTAVHLLSYEYDEEADEAQPMKGVRLEVPCEGASAAVWHTLEGTQPLPFTCENGTCTLEIPTFRIFGIVELTV